MNREIIPTLLVDNKSDFEERLSMLQKYNIPVAQIDIMDGKFVKNRTFTHPEIAKNYTIKYELHLMVEDPESVIDEWTDVPGVKSAIIPLEIKKSLLPIIKKIKNSGWEASISINPETAWKDAEELIPKLDSILLMTVHPGKNGAPFEPSVLSKIKNLRKTHPKLTIEVDGGVNEETLPLLLSVGVSRFAIGSAIWKSPDPKKTYKQFLSIIKKFK